MDNWNLKFWKDNIAKKYINFDDFWHSIDNVRPREFEKYPYRPDFKEHENQVKKNFVGTFDEINNALEEAKKLDDNDYQKAINRHYKFVKDLENLAKYKISLEHRTLNEKQFDIIWDKAWELADSHNFNDVADMFDEFMDVIENYLKNK